MGPLMRARLCDYGLIQDRYDGCHSQASPVMLYLGVGGFGDDHHGVVYKLDVVAPDWRVRRAGSARSSMPDFDVRIARFHQPFLRLQTKTRPVGTSRAKVAR